jgi:hypothetical protein
MKVYLKPYRTFSHMYKSAIGLNLEAMSSIVSLDEGLGEEVPGQLGRQHFSKS